MASPILPPRILPNLYLSVTPSSEKQLPPHPRSSGHPKILVEGYHSYGGIHI
nr:MAG TPA: hypothetical protein [Caudoviricetes sp.]